MGGFAWVGGGRNILAQMGSGEGKGGGGGQTFVMKYNLLRLRM